jgi:L-glutamine:2-deoxy-scyllo-inosose/3-amino-2,3-dideoxy-scyllo-inosose aminotransferase
LTQTSVQRIAEALSAELGLVCKPMYSSLDQCRLYRPETRRRFALSASFQTAVQPQRFELPVARAFAHSHIALPHRFLLANESDMFDVRLALEKVFVQANRL